MQSKFIHTTSSILLIILIIVIGCSSDRRRTERSQNRIIKEEPLVPEINISNLEMRIHNLTNIKRHEKGMPSLAYDNRLSEIARKHSEDMAKRNFFSHENPDGKDPTDRGKAAGYPIRKDQGTFYSIGLGENLFLTSAYRSMTSEGLAEFTVDSWMHSPKHRKNLLDPNFDREGIGGALSPDYKVLITQNLW